MKRVLALFSALALVTATSLSSPAQAGHSIL